MTHGSDLPGGREGPGSPDGPTVGRGPTAYRGAVGFGLDAPAELLRVVASQPRAGVYVVAPRGELDVSTADLLRQAIREAFSAVPRCVVIDLSGLTFCGSTGLVVLMEAEGKATTANVRFCTVGGSPIVRRILEITQLGSALCHRETVAEVLRDLPGDDGP